MNLIFKYKYTLACLGCFFCTWRRPLLVHVNHVVLFYCLFLLFSFLLFSSILGPILALSLVCASNAVPWPLASGGGPNLSGLRPRRLRVHCLTSTRTFMHAAPLLMFPTLLMLSISSPRCMECRRLQKELDQGSIVSVTKGSGASWLHEDIDC